MSYRIFGLLLNLHAGALTDHQEGSHAALKTPLRDPSDRACLKNHGRRQDQ